MSHNKDLIIKECENLKASEVSSLIKKEIQSFLISEKIRQKDTYIRAERSTNKSQ